MIPRLLMNFSGSSPYTFQQTDFTEKVFEKRTYTKSNYSYFKKKKGSKFKTPPKKFDPNQYSQKDWMNIGMSEKQAALILKFGTRGFYSEEDLKIWAEKTNAKAGDLVLLLCGETEKVRKQMNELRLHLGNELGLRNPNEYKPLWVLDFPLLEWDEENNRYHAMHHPFTSVKPADMEKMKSNFKSNGKMLKHLVAKILKANERKSARCITVQRQKKVIIT